MGPQARPRPVGSDRLVCEVPADHKWSVWNRQLPLDPGPMFEDRICENCGAIERRTV